jgi:hypothetical protein
MGGLIATRGTRRLVRHYNDIFDKQSIATTKTKIMDNPQVLQCFTNPAGLPIFEITHLDGNTFLPARSADHPNLLKRWDYYLHREMQSQNQIKLTQFIAAVLNFPSGRTGPLGDNQRGDRYKRIHFDCIQAAPGQSQTVVQSDEYRLKGANDSDDDDRGLLKSAAYSLIVLITDPIQNAPDPLDNQNF